MRILNVYIYRSGLVFWFNLKGDSTSYFFKMSCYRMHIYLLLMFTGPLSCSRKDPLKLGLSILPSILLSVQTFTWGCMFFFSKFWLGSKKPYEVVHDTARISEKKFFATKIGKWAKNKVFKIYWKIWSLIFTGLVL